jgi:prepilin-type processing-associated H-X9-DG protein
MHPNGLQFVFVDGSVKFISDTIDSRRCAPNISPPNMPQQCPYPPSVYSRLYYRDDGSPPGDY